ncbi:MAG TPA: transketolase [Candidatus Polarisedimenticolia bacterium]|nr:transketolase [Candidatus Polarisedimenticolia bacterium]
MTDPFGSWDQDRLSITTLKMLAVDAVEKAKSGHPGMPLGMAEVAYTLWTKFLRFDPERPDWPDRDRFVLSAGHGSMLLYGLLHLSGYDLPLEELKRFRQWGSRTPGHPEYHFAPGIETTTGPLGQGLGNSVGMAIGAKRLAARFNTSDRRLIDHRVWALCSDGDIMEGVGSEAASIAGHLQLGNLTLLYDDNHITIEGSTDLALSEDVGKRFEAYGFRVWRIDGHDLKAVHAALDEASKERARPGIVVCRTHIGHGAPHKQDTAEAHGSPLGPEETAETKKNLGWPLEPAFLVPDQARQPYQARAAFGKTARLEWEKRLAAWKKGDVDGAKEWDAILERQVPKDLLAQLIGALPTPAKPDASRNLSGKILQRAAEVVPALAGGSADLEPSTKTWIKGSPAVAPGQFSGRNFHFGVREHAMGSILNGLALEGGVIPYGATFLIFSDYMRPPMRLAALMELPVVYVFTHDSIFLGEDGPTHQPIEQLASLRTVLNLIVVRPADGPETAAAWTLALQRQKGPTALVLTRQDVPVLERPAGFDPALMLKGGYVLSDGGQDLVLIASGSEVGSAIEAQKILKEKGVASRVVSMPCPQLFAKEPESYRNAVVPEGSRIVVIEAASLNGWERIAGTDALLVGIDRYGSSAPWKVLQEEFGFTGPKVADRILSHFGRS